MCQWITCCSTWSCCLPAPSVPVSRASQRVQISASVWSVVCVGALGAHASQGSCRLARRWSLPYASGSCAGVNACAVTGVALAGHAAVPDDDWALPGQSSDCLRTRAWPSSTCWTAHSAQAVPELINLSGPAADLHLQGLAAVPYAVRTLTS